MTPWVNRLLIANVGMFFAQSTILRGYEGLLAFTPALAFTQPWTIVTYMFLHGGLMHLLFNMMGLYFFGSQVEARMGPQRFITLYLLSGITGALLSMVFSPMASVIGASGGVFGVMLAFAMFWPREQIMIWGIVPVEARILVIITTALALFGGFGGGRGNTAHFAHLGGYVGAFVYLKWLERRAGAKAFRAKTVSAPPDKALTNWKKIDLSTTHEINREEVNRILDKINAAGMGSLTAGERAFLSNFVPPDDRPVS